MSPNSGPEGRGPGVDAALLVLLVTVGVGVAGGLAAYHVADPAPGEPVHVPDSDGGTIRTDVTALAFLLLGGFAGLVVGYAALGVPWVRRALDALGGLLPSDPATGAGGGGEPSDDGASPWRRPTGWSAAGLAALLVLALALRLREPLSSLVIGAEDPYVHMARTWDLVQLGTLPEGYPPGLMFMLAPAALLGPDAFYWFARFAPPFAGVVEVLGVFLLCRYMLDEAAGFAGGFLAAVTPENITRTTLLFPTALTLAVLPFAFLFLFRALEGHRGSRQALAALALLLLVTHPWGLGLAAPPILAYWFLTADGNRVTVAGICTLVAGGVVALFYLLPATWNPFPVLFGNVQHQVAYLAADPSSLWTNLPVYVDPPAMLTYPVMAAGALGAGVAAARRSRIGLFALCWTLLTLPIVLVHWFGMWFLPHRTVVFLGLGLAMLGAVLFHALARSGPGVGRTRRAAGLAFAAVLVVSTVPAAAETSPWYRIYDQQDYEFWSRLEEHDPPLVVAPSWETKAGYRALTGNPAIHDEVFFEDRQHRERVLAKDPGLLVVYDEEFADDAPSAFLDDWTVRETSDTATAYEAPADRR